MEASRATLGAERTRVDSFNPFQPRPFVDVRGPGFNATLDVQTGEVLAGQLPTKELRQVRQLLDEHRELALEAFDRAFRHDFPGTLDQQLEGDQ